MYSPAKLKAIRESRNLTQKKLAALCARHFPNGGVSLSSIRDFEAGTRPGIYTIPLISLALGIPLRSLKCDDAEPKNGKNGKKRKIA